jgi:anaerobic C4-dicarboxylate transporter
MSTHPNNPNRHFIHYKQKLKYKADNGDKIAAQLLGRKDVGIKLSRSEISKNLWKDPEYRKKCLAGLEKAKAARKKVSCSYKQQLAIMISRLGIVSVDTKTNVHTCTVTTTESTLQ